MRYLISLLLLFPLFMFGQPVPSDRERFERIDSITERLKKNPNDDVLRWKRINLIFYHFRLDFEYKDRCVEDTASHIITRNSVLYGDKRKKILSYKGIYVIDELNQLIKNNAKFIIGSIDANDFEIDFELDKNPREIVYTAPACLYFKRGLCYDAKGIDSLAVKDYLMALSYELPKTLKESICFSLAANYYHQYKQNARKQILDTTSLKLSLNYIDKITPIIYESEPRVLDHYSGVYLDKYEKEKILLLKETKNINRLVSYLSNLTLSYLNLYASENLKSEQYQKANSFGISESLNTANRYLAATLEIINGLDNNSPIKYKFYARLSEVLKQK
jgi:hypothetical protein